VEALFKPKVEGDADGWHRAPVELIAYELNLMLGMDYVPPVSCPDISTDDFGSTYDVLK
jgi:hypothetical protein